MRILNWARLTVFAAACGTVACGGARTWPEPVAGTRRPAAEPSSAADGPLEIVADGADTPARRQLQWALDAIGQAGTLTPEAVGAHLSPGFSAKLAPEKLIEVFTALKAQLGGLGAPTLVGQTRFRLALRVPTEHGAIIASAAVEDEAPHRLTELLFRPAPTPETELPQTWTDIDARLKGMADEVHLYAARIDPAAGRCTPLHSVNADTPASLGSAFKLYVLVALAEAVAQGKMKWTDTLAIREAWKSLPSGKLQNEPAGTALPLSTYADQMISISDNTATDHLLYHLGRPAVEATVAASGHHNPALLRPFMATREFFKLKLFSDDATRTRWLATDEAGRRAWLASPAATAPFPPLDQVPAWKTPVEPARLEWRATGADLCSLVARFAAHADDAAWQPALHSLALNHGGLTVDPTRWAWVGYKGGSEPGVLFLQWILRDTTGNWVAVSLGVLDAKRPLDVGALVDLGRAAVLRLGRDLATAPGT